MQVYLNQLLDAMPRLSVRAMIDILLVALLIYQSVMILRGRRAARILLGLATVLVIYGVARMAQLEMLRTVLEALAPYTAFALIVMFQSELRRMLARLGERPWMSVGSRFQTREMSDEIMLAAGHLAQHSVGALIVLEGDIGLRSFIESGVSLDARVTRDLLLAIFQPGGALHDGAVIVQSGRIAAAACFLPLTMNPLLSGQLGTRHRAAIGVTEESDCLAIVVSEERGSISLASGGEIELDVSMERLAERLKQPFSSRTRPASSEAKSSTPASAREVRP